MKPPLFAYRDPETVPAALELLLEWGDEAKVLAGGQSLVPILNFRLARPAILIDINRIADLAGIEPLPDTRHPTPDTLARPLRVGALTRHVN
ncbi:MAG TPA: FAD binding domain-containing protein, partial [Dehalococcoidia bacterium]|nr:FAD binding domain-containing protein [Dehalococcoidia bacterium]